MIDLTKNEPDYILIIREDGKRAIKIYIHQENKDCFVGIAVDNDGFYSIVGIKTSEKIEFNLNRFANKYLTTGNSYPKEFQFSLQGHDIHMGEVINGLGGENKDVNCTIETAEKYFVRS